MTWELQRVHVRRQSKAKDAHFFLKSTHQEYLQAQRPEKREYVKDQGQKPTT